MSLSEDTVTDIKRELAGLRHSRSAINARIKSLNAVLRQEHRQRSSTPKMPSQKKIDRQNLSPLNKPRRRKTPALSLRRSITSALEKTPGRRSGELVKLLNEAGVTVRGKTPLSKRVYRELGRMKVKGLIRRSANGAYALVGSGIASTGGPVLA